MNNRQVVLKLVLDELGVDNKIKTIDDRKRLQKAIYLGQLSGVDLSYRFSFYLMGPYSTSLTQDYFKLDEAIKSGDSSYSDHKLKQSVKDSLLKIKPLLNVPEELETKLDQVKWLELIASLHYLLRVSKLNKKDAFDYMEVEKPTLYEYLDIAYTYLENYKL